MKHWSVLLTSELFFFFFFLGIWLFEILIKFYFCFLNLDGMVLRETNDAPILKVKFTRVMITGMTFHMKN